MPEVTDTTESVQQTTPSTQGQSPAKVAKLEKAGDGAIGWGLRNLLIIPLPIPIPIPIPVPLPLPVPILRHLPTSHHSRRTSPQHSQDDSLALD